jgi:hypothetical protein
MALLYKKYLSSNTFIKDERPDSSDEDEAPPQVSKVDSFSMGSWE